MRERRVATEPRIGRSPCVYVENWPAQTFSDDDMSNKTNLTNTMVSKSLATARCAGVIGVAGVVVVTLVSFDSTFSASAIVSSPLLSLSVLESTGATATLSSRSITNRSNYTKQTNVNTTTQQHNNNKHLYRRQYRTKLRTNVVLC
jgi:hypothetical protein